MKEDFLATWFKVLNWLRDLPILFFDLIKGELNKIDGYNRNKLTHRGDASRKWWNSSADTLHYLHATASQFTAFA